jgi:hypothetical protein
MKDVDSGNYRYWLGISKEQMYYPYYRDSVEPILYEHEDLVVSYTASQREQIRREYDDVLTRSLQRSYLEKITALYRFYVADSIVGNWKQFITSVKETEGKLKDKKISEVSYNRFNEECNEKIGFDIIKLMERVEPLQCFDDSLTIQEQKDFLIKMDNYEFPFYLKVFTDIMLKQLDTVTELRFMPGIPESFDSQ